jgi:predicted amidohydrolase
MTVRIACCQIAPSVEEPQRNAALTTDAIAHAIDDGARVVVVPELATSGYVFRSVEEVRAAATTPDGEPLRAWAAQASRADAIVIGGFCEVDSEGRLFNSSALIDGDGVRAVYRKLHLWDDERRWFTPGEQPAPVVETRYGRIGLAVCYDLEFPELTRGLALGGAELIAVPLNWPHESAAPDGRPVLYSLAAMTAYWSKVFVAVCDRCGTERGVEFEGGSVIAGPTGALLAGPVSARDVETLHAEVELSDARDKRTGRDNDAFADRRADHYEGALIDR